MVLDARGRLIDTCFPRVMTIVWGEPFKLHVCALPPLILSRPLLQDQGYDWGSVGVGYISYGLLLQEAGRSVCYELRAVL